jgi:hypothetical protein
VRPWRALGYWSARSCAIVLASGLQDGLYHQYAQRYKEILAAKA